MPFRPGADADVLICGASFAGLAGLLEQALAELRVVDRGERPRQLPTGARDRGRVHEQRAERLPDRRLHAHVAQPLGRGRAGRGLALADLVTIEHKHPRAGRAQLPSNGQARERGTADEYVGVRIG